MGASAARSGRADRFAARAGLEKTRKPARRRGERPEEKEAERVARLAAELERADEAQIHGVEDREKQRRAGRPREKRGPQNPDRLFHRASLTIRQVPRGSSMTARQRPAGIGGSSAA